MATPRDPEGQLLPKRSKISSIGGLAHGESVSSKASWIRSSGSRGAIGLGRRLRFVSVGFGGWGDRWGWGWMGRSGGEGAMWDALADRRELAN